MLFGKSKEKDVFLYFEKHLNYLELTLKTLEETTQMYIEKNKEYEQKSKKMHEIEHKADETEVKIRHLLFKGAFYQGLRTDFAELVTQIDSIFGSAVIVGRKFSEEKPNTDHLTDELKGLLIDMCTESVKMVDPLKQAILFLTKDVNEIERCCDKVRNFESNVDSLIHKFIKRLFAMDIELAEKLQFRDLILYLGQITDQAEDIADRIGILAMNINI